MNQIHLFRNVITMFLLACCFALPAFSQQKGSVSGKITDENKNGAIGASILLSGTTLGASTDLDGNYRITNVPAGTYTAEISYIGYRKEKRQIVVSEGEKVAFNFQLITDTKTLDQVVVTGYGTQSKREVTGSVSSVKAKDLNNIPVSSFDAAMQGRAAGVQVTQSNGAAGSAVRIRVRGTKSLSAGGEPLYVIDGIPVENNDLGGKEYGATSAVPLNPLASINPNDIESIDILKDAAATAIYGARGNNGVILVTTKRGKGGKTAFSFNYATGWSNPTNKLAFLDGNQYKNLFMEAYRNDSTTAKARNQSVSAFPTAIGDGNFFALQGNNEAERKANFMAIPTNTNWFDEVFQVGKTNDVNISATGGNDKTKFYVGGGINKTTTMLRGNEFDRFSFRTNIDNQATDKVKVGTQTGIYFTRNRQVATSYNGGFGSAQSTSLPLFPVRNADNTFFGTQLANPATYFNPTAQLENQYVTNNFRSLSNVYMDFTPIKGLTYHVDLGMDFANQQEELYFSGVNRYYQRRPFSAFKERNVNFLKLVLNNTLNYTKEYKDNTKFGILLGTAQEGYNQRDVGFYPFSDAVGFNDPYYRIATSQMTWATWAPPNVDRSALPIGGFNDRSYYRYSSFFARVNYQYQGKFIVQAQIRRDGSSRFGPQNRFGNFPSVSFGYALSEEKLFKQFEKLSYLKLRLGYGHTGNSQYGTDVAWFGSISQSGNYLGNNGTYASRIENKFLSWELQRQGSVGLDFGFFDNRISGGIDGYYGISGGKNGGILLRRPVQISGEGIDKVFVNAPVLIENWGIELTTSTQNFVGEFRWSTDFNIAMNRNKVLDAAGIPPDGFDAGPGDTRVIEGQPIGISYLLEYAGLNKETGYDQVYVMRDGVKTVVQLDGRANAAELRANRKPFGNPNPTLIGGINNNLSYKGFDLSFQFTFSYGNTIYDDGGKYQWGQRLYKWNQRGELLDRWQQPGDDNGVQKLTLNPSRYSIAEDDNNTTRFLYDGSFIRLRNLNFGYNLPAKACEKLKIQNIKFYVMAQNYLTLTRFKGWDPEVTRYSDGGTSEQRNSQGNISFAAPYLATPQQKTLTVGLNLGF